MSAITPKEKEERVQLGCKQCIGSKTLPVPCLASGQKRCLSPLPCPLPCLSPLPYDRFRFLTARIPAQANGEY